jgi:hypothetical protein
MRGIQGKKIVREMLNFFMLVLALQLATALPAVFAWDAGTESRRHNEGTGGEQAITIFDTRPFWARSTGLTTSGRVADCPAGYTNTGLTCYRGPDTISNPSILANCPAGYTNMGLTCYQGPDTYSKGCTTIFKKYECNPGYTDNGCFCGKGATSLGIDSMVCPSGYTKGTAGRCYKACPSGYTNNGEFCGRGADSMGMDRMTCGPNERRIIISGTTIPRCYQKPVCPTGYEYWGLLCYVSAPYAHRTAVSTVTMDVKIGGNTHLWIVNRALELLDKSGDPAAKAWVAEMRRPEIRTAWENGLWDGDDSNHSDGVNLRSGSHFYNGAGKDWRGNNYSYTTFAILGLDANATPQGHNRNGRENAAYYLSKVSGPLDAAKAYNLGLALHFLTDATQPMHTSGFDGSAIPTNLHPHYEYYVPFIQARFPTTSMTWDKRWPHQDPDEVFRLTAVKSNGYAQRLLNALHYSGDAGIVTIQAFNGVGPYTGYNFYNDPNVDSLTGEILQDAYQSAASYLYNVYKKETNSL